MKATFEGRIEDESSSPVLEAIAAHLGHAERHLFVDRYVRRRPLTALKREYIARFGITARQFNAIAEDLQGRVRASRSAVVQRVRRLRERISHLRRLLRKRKKRLAKEEDSERRGRLRFLLHQKKRHLRALEQRLDFLQEETVRSVPGVCFGSRRMFREQFHLHANGYRSHEEWLADWRQARSGGFLCLGSRDERGGNQTATLLPGGILRLRVPPALEGEYGRWILLHGIRFPYGQDVIDLALKLNQPITIRFVRRKRKGKWVWYVQATTERPGNPITTRRELGALGVDYNPGVVAVGRIDRHGNPTARRHFPAETEGKSRRQREAILGDIVADIVAWAKGEGVPIVIEELDFTRKKAALREMYPELARKLSRFDYRRFHDLLISRAAREGVEVIEVEPDYTSVIGWVKFGSGYHLSVHTAAAVAIARRGLGFGEALSSREPGEREGSASPLPVRNRGEHVWSAWERVRRRLRAHRVRGRRPARPAGGRMRGIPLSAAAPTRSRSQPGGKGPPRDGPPSGPGELTPAQTVGSAVRPAP